MANKKRAPRKRAWLLFLLAVAAAAAYFQFADRPAPPPEQNYRVEKPGAGTNVDFSAKTRQLQRAVDAALADHHLKAAAVKEEDKKVGRRSIEGEIRWHSRRMSIPWPDGRDQAAFRRQLETRLAAVGGKILSETRDQKDWRLEIGLTDSLDGDPVTIVSDRLTLTAAAPPRPAPPPAAAVKGRLALVIDDFGYSAAPIEAYASIKRPLTFAVLPHHPYSKRAAARGLKDGRHVILHLPMEPMSKAIQSETATIEVGMDQARIDAMIAAALASVPGAGGVNNHQGSRATADAAVMKETLRVLKSRGLYFIDSRTSSRSIAYETAREMGVPTAENTLFIDNDSDLGAIRRQLRRAAAIAVRNGGAIAIGHARPNTARAIEEAIPELEADGIRLVFASDLLR